MELSTKKNGFSQTFECYYNSKTTLWLYFQDTCTISNIEGNTTGERTGHTNTAVQNASIDVNAGVRRRFLKS